MISLSALKAARADNRTHAVFVCQPLKSAIEMNSEPLSPQANAALVRLQYAKPLQLNDVLKEVLDHGEALSQAAQLVESRIDEGCYVVNEYVAELVLRTESSSLYAKVREQFIRNDWTLLSLYKARYPDEEIEERLCRTLYDGAADDADPKRRLIAEAMADVGTDAAPTLEAILFEHLPTLKARKIFADSIETSDGAPPKSMRALLYDLAVKSRAAFLEAVAVAIDTIRNRAKNS